MGKQKVFEITPKHIRNEVGTWRPNGVSVDPEVYLLAVISLKVQYSFLLTLLNIHEPLMIIFSEYRHFTQ